MEPVIAIFDIGKTNKKLFLFDENYQIIYEKSIHLDEIIDEDGDLCEDLIALTNWVKDSFNEVLANPAFQIKALNFSAYGASFVHLDRAGKAAAPLYNYLKLYPEWLNEKFEQTYDREKNIALQTASPMLGNLNSGRQIYLLKYAKPELFKKIGVSLHLPQYISSVFTGQYFSEITSMGCHTLLWNFEIENYHHWVQEEKIEALLPSLAPSDSVVKASIGHHEIPCGIGLHDSSSALIPYLESFKEPFVLLSTGTWCISLNPFNHEPLTPSELQQDCLCYLSFQAKPVKASRLFSGFEHEMQIKRLADYFHRPENYFSEVSYDPALIHELPFIDDLSNYQSYEEAYHSFIRSLVYKQVASTRLILNKPITRIFVDGGFSKNSIFMNMLSKAFPMLEVFAASVAQASALGAALAIHAHWNIKQLPSDIISLKYFSSN